MLAHPTAPELDDVADPSGANAIASSSPLAETQAAPQEEDDGEPIPLRARVGSVVGRYALGELLGRGGMGEVYAGLDVKSGEEVAIKLLRPELLASAQALARFHREATLTRKLRGPHAVRVIEVGGEGTAPFIAMERLHGYDLADLLDRRRQLDISEAVAWVMQACEAVAQAHDVGVIHRDLKPANLFVATTPDGPILKVLDFGISRLRDESGKLTATHNTLGTPIYMAPEQAKSSRVADARSDVWSLGVILYELLTNAVPFNGDSPTAIAVNVCTVPPAPLSTWRRDVPPEIEAIIMKALSKDPEARFASPRDFADAIRPFAGSVLPADEASSPPISLSVLRAMPTERLRAQRDDVWAPRRRSLALAAGCAVLVCAAVPFVVGSGGAAEGQPPAAPRPPAAWSDEADSTDVLTKDLPTAFPVATEQAPSPKRSQDAQALASAKTATVKIATVTARQTASSPRRARPEATSPRRYTRPKFDERR